MKTIAIHLTQEPAPGLYRVARFTNTVQLSVGMLVKAADVEHWCATPRINVHVDGLTQPAKDQELPLLESGEQTRREALKLP